MKKTILTFVIATISMIGFAQKKTSTSATIAFDASTAIDDLPKAENKTAVAAIDLAKNTVQFEAAIKNFAFSNPKIQEHFNTKNWLNSDEFPKATFSGVITNPSAVDFKKDGTYNVNVEGDLTIRGTTQKVTTPATIVVAGKTVKANAAFNIKLADFGVEGQPITAGKVSSEPKITVSAELN
ncbi:MAG TPA: YceI family protein [Chitinophagaceae bacterium]|nr:YceI family protein [Chitinophagaceae bacterium]